MRKHALAKWVCAAATLCRNNSTSRVYGGDSILSSVVGPIEQIVSHVNTRRFITSATDKGASIWDFNWMLNTGCARDLQHSSFLVSVNWQLCGPKPDKSTCLNWLIWCPTIYSGVLPKQRTLIERRNNTFHRLELTIYGGSKWGNTIHRW